MKKRVVIVSLVMTTAFLFVDCTCNDEATQQSLNIGYKNAEGGTTPHQLASENSATKNRAGEASENSGSSQPLDAVNKSNSKPY
jgi:hypothetical protein